MNFLRNYRSVTVHSVHSNALRDAQKSCIRMISRRNSRVFCELCSQKTPRGTLPVNSNCYCSLRTSAPNISIPACKKVITFVLYYTHLRFFIARIFCRHISRLFDIVTVHSVTSNTLRDAQKDEPSCDKHKK